MEQTRDTGRSRSWTGCGALLLFAAVLAAIYLGKFWYLLLTNLNLPPALDSGSILASLLIVLLSLAGGGSCVLVIAAVGRASSPGFVAVLVVTLLLAWVLYPVACDTHESFVDQPNKVCECSGATLAYYPQGTMDGAEIEYCIGLERPLA
ncbi:MAG: hypothetical protein ACR2HO_12890 [Rubrobacteraceae bacterium]|nr:hypothetical protein [Rubrobacter sp.]